MACTVVLIDDEPWTREVIKSLGQWDKLNLTVVGEASDGEYGLELIRRLKPDIILTDIKMPRQNGISLLEKLRETDQRTRVIVISGYDDFSFVHSAMHLGVTDYLLKPVKPEELNKQLEKCVRELLEEKNVPYDQPQGLDGFLHVSWIGEYLTRRSALMECLRAGNPEILKNCFVRLGELPGVKNEGEMQKGLLVALYYDLMGVLQRHILGEGFTVSQVLSGMESTFVFSQDATFTSMLAHVQKVYLTAAVQMEKLIRARGRLDLDAIVRYVKENACKGITLEETAARFFVTKEYLSKIFKTHTGDNFSDFVMRLRMEKAKELLCSLRMPVKEVGELTGFLDPAHFYKAFKRFYGVTPGEMAKSCSNK
jgi:two-component system response regulator YesN